MIKNDDIALIIRPNVGADKKWAGTVDLKAMIMPTENMTEENAQELVYLLHGLIACFNLLNEDEKFAERVNEELVKLKQRGDYEFTIEEPAYDNVISMTEWTNTRGNA
jgi:hypothetical protein